MKQKLSLPQKPFKIARKSSKRKKSYPNSKKVTPSSNAKLLEFYCDLFPLPKVRMTSLEKGVLYIQI